VISMLCLVGMNLMFVLGGKEMTNFYHVYACIGILEFFGRNNGCTFINPYTHVALPMLFGFSYDCWPGTALPNDLS
jgi:hypothetical protein